MRAEVVVKVADLPSVKEEIARLRRENETLRSLAFAGGPYTFGKVTDEVVHADPCDCDEDEEQTGEACMALSDWTYAVFADLGSFLGPPIVKLPRVPVHCEGCGAPLLIGSVCDDC